MKIRWNDRAIEKLLVNATVDERVKVADRIADAARAAAPGSQGRGIRVERNGDTVRVVNKSSIWHLIEFGSVNNPDYRPLRRGAESVVDYKPTPK